MLSKDNGHESITSSDQALVLSALERDQLAARKKHLIPRRHLGWHEMFVMWSLRIYLLFMMAVVLYQVWTSLHQ
jgi:hypothetical protein